MRLSVDIPDELHRDIRIAAAQRGTTVTKVVIAAIEEHLGQHARSVNAVAVSVDPKPLQKEAFVRPISKEDQAKGRTRK